jgi:hypothetical protein
LRAVSRSTSASSVPNQATFSKFGTIVVTNSYTPVVELAS